MSYGMDGWNHDNDLVRRKDVMDSLVKEYNRRYSLGERNGLHLAWIEKAVNEVDVAQQGKTQLSQEDATSDLISRAEAIDAFEKLIKDCNPDHFVGHQKFIEFMDNAEIGSFGKWQFANGFNMGLTAAEVTIKNLPSAQPERKTGRWIDITKTGGDFVWKCSECGELNLEDTYYCPSCGADMRGGA